MDQSEELADLHLDRADEVGGILTDDDRRYLLGQKDFEEYDNPQKVEQQQRYRIRKRIENAIKDFHLVGTAGHQLDLSKIFDGYITEEELDIEDILLLEGYRSLLLMFWVQLGQADDLAAHLLKESTESAIEEGVKWHTFGHADVDLLIKGDSPQILHERFEDNEELSANEYMALYHTDHISAEEFKEHVTEDDIARLAEEGWITQAASEDILEESG